MKLLKKVVVIFLLSVLILVGVFALLINSSINSRECSSLSDIEAKDMISRIFSQKHEKSKTGLIIFDINPKKLNAGNIERYQSDDDSLGYLDIEYLDQQSGKLKIIASIYDNCEVQWIKGQ